MEGGSGSDGAAAAPSPVIQVIVLGSGGGPQEANTTAFLVRSLSSKWSKSSIVAVDAGVHLSAITRILEQTQPASLGEKGGPPLPYTIESGPFKGLEVESASPAANATYIHCKLIDTYLITHPHLDHIAGFVVNTAGIAGSRPKRLAGLPSTIAAFKNHIFNNVIWPNLSDENNGAGLVTYMRLVDGGSPAIGDGEGRGYVELSDGLSVKIWGVSHGHCIEKHSHRGSGATSRYGSVDASIGSGMADVGIHSPHSPRTYRPQRSSGTGLGLLQQSQSQQDSRRSSVADVTNSPASPLESICVYDSSAYFIRDLATGREILIFGDVESDSISLSPRNRQLWCEAAPKVVAGKLAAIFIECSYDNSQPEDLLFGHLTPRFLVEEMAALASEVKIARDPEAAAAAASMLAKGGKKRKRSASAGTDGGSGDPGAVAADGIPAELELQDLTVVIIHVKQKPCNDVPVGETILAELLEAAATAGLGCKFVISEAGKDYFF
ncbi:Cyclic-AMP phosphodiesterase, class-II [Pleurostoma richardsiae]|uniref:Cyclic-AMP phosphodiesterase, class-II n=1 Tax=Pleurostoma richardsiae TaxID=41990 RepID=A0AA38RN36_9PEZI|nr:Cyclic-AMP phosphodiesterase, class-II [Pleurostoma richardsiae]